MQKLGILSLVVGLLTVIGALAQLAYSMVSAFTAAQTDAAAAAPAVSLTTPLNVTVGGVVLLIASRE